MAVEFLAYYGKEPGGYVALSSDTLPTLDDRAIGTPAFYSDTGEWLEWHGVARGWVERREPRTFVGGEAITGSTTTLFQLWNPPDSTVNLIVESFSVNVLGAGAVNFWHTTSKFTGTPIAISWIGALDFSGAAPVGELWYINNETETGIQLLQAYCPSANIDMNIPEIAGVIITPGTGLTARYPVANTFRPRVKWSEVAI